MIFLHKLVYMYFNEKKKYNNHKTYNGLKTLQTGRSLLQLTHTHTHTHTLLNDDIMLHTMYNTVHLHVHV